jgi:hypothetical protein
MTCGKMKNQTAFFYFFIKEIKHKFKWKKKINILKIEIKTGKFLTKVINSKTCEFKLCNFRSEIQFIMRFLK